MVFQLGKTGVSKFKNMWKALSALEYSTAASEMLDSRWAKQTPNRAQAMSAQMASLGQVRLAVVLGLRLPWQQVQSNILWSKTRLDEAVYKTQEEKEMKILILTGLVAIIIILLFIAVMIYAIGEKISEK